MMITSNPAPGIAAPKPNLQPPPPDLGGGGGGGGLRVQLRRESGRRAIAACLSAPLGNVCHIAPGEIDLCPPSTG